MVTISPRMSTSGAMVAIAPLRNRMFFTKSISSFGSRAP